MQYLTMMKKLILMTYNIISTGSKGNAVVIGGFILIDCGVPFSRLHEVYRDISIVLLTHIHSDHFNAATIKRLAQERPTLRFGCCEWLKDKLLSCGVECERIDIYDAGAKYDYGKFALKPERLIHNVPNCGYKLYINGERVFYATDTSSLEHIHAEGYDLYMVEANYELEKTVEVINRKLADGVYSYEENAIKNHLSKSECDSFLHNNMKENGSFVYMHRHIYEENSA